MFTWYWLRRCQDLGAQDHEYIAYSACVVVASLFFLAAIWPLLGMTPTPQRRRNEPPPVRATLRDLAAPLIDVRYRQLLGFGVLFSLANGIFISVRRPLEMGALSLYEKKVLDAGSRGAQSLLTPQLGRLADRRGNRLLLVWSQLVIALAPLAVLAVRINGGEVDPKTRGWILAAYVCWLAYAAQNVAQPNLMLNLAPRDRRASYIAVWFAMNQFALALGVFVGARLLSWQTVRGAENSANLLPLLLGSSAIICTAAWQASRIPEAKFRAQEDQSG